MSASVVPKSLARVPTGDKRSDRDQAGLALALVAVVSSYSLAHHSLSLITYIHTERQRKQSSFNHRSHSSFPLHIARGEKKENASPLHQYIATREIPFAYLCTRRVERRGRDHRARLMVGDRGRSLRCGIPCATPHPPPRLCTRGRILS